MSLYWRGYRSERKRSKASIMMFFSISKRSELVRQFENLFRSEANMFILKNLNIEAKRSKLMLNCESSEAKRRCSIVKKTISKRSEHVYNEQIIKSKRSEHVRQFENLFRSEANMLIFKNLNIEAKRRKLTLTCESSEHSYFQKIKLAKRSQQVRQ